MICPTWYFQLVRVHLKFRFTTIEAFKTGKKNVYTCNWRDKNVTRSLKYIRYVHTFMHAENKGSNLLITT